MAKKKENLSLEEMLEQAIVKEEDRPYEVPENWVWTRLGIIGEIVTGNTPSKNNADNYGRFLPFFKPTDLNQGFFVSEASEYLSQEGAKRARVIPERSTLVTCIGATIGKCGYIRVDGSTNQQINSIIPHKQITNKYVYFLLSSPFMQDNIISNSSSTTLPILNKSRFESLYLPLPPLHEQQRIVALIESFFEKLDRAKELVQNALDSFENRKSAILHKAFTGELTAKWRDENGVDFERDWKQIKFKDFCLLQRGYDLPSGQRQLGDYPLVSSSGIIDTHSEAKAKGPGVITGRSGSIGKVFYVEDDYWPLNTTLFSLNMYNNYPKYIYYYLTQFDFKQYSSSTAVPTLNRNNFADVTVYVPPLPEQQEIVRILDSLLERSQRAKELVDLVENIDHMKKSILARAFRGELGTNNPEEESAMELLKEVIEEKLN